MGDVKHERSGLKFPGRGIKELLSFHKKTHSHILSDSHAAQPPAQTYHGDAQPRRGDAIQPVASRLPKPTPPSAPVQEDIAAVRHAALTPVSRIPPEKEANAKATAQVLTEWPSQPDDEDDKRNSGTAPVNIHVTAGTTSMLMAVNEHIAEDVTAPQQALSVHASTQSARPMLSDHTVVDIAVPQTAVSAQATAQRQHDHAHTRHKPVSTSEPRRRGKETITSAVRAAAARAARQAASAGRDTAKQAHSGGPIRPKIATRSRVGALEPVPERTHQAAASVSQALTPRTKARQQARERTHIPKAPVHKLIPSASSPVGRGAVRSAAAPNAASPKRRYGYNNGQSGTSSAATQPSRLSTSTPTLKDATSRLHTERRNMGIRNLPQLSVQSAPTTPRGQAPQPWRAAGPLVHKTPATATSTPRKHNSTWGKPCHQQAHLRSSSVAVASRPRPVLHRHTRFASAAYVAGPADSVMFAGALRAPGWPDCSPGSSMSDIPSYMAPTASSRRRVEIVSKEKQSKVEGDEQLENYVVEHQDPAAGDVQGATAKDNSIWAAALETLSPCTRVMSHTAPSPRPLSAGGQTVRFFTNNIAQEAAQTEAAMPGRFSEDLGVDETSERHTSHVPVKVDVANLVTLSRSPRPHSSFMHSSHASANDEFVGVTSQGPEDNEEDAPSPYLAPADVRFAVERPTLHSSGDNSSSADSTPHSSRYRYPFRGEEFVQPPSPLGPKLSLRLTALQALSSSDSQDTPIDETTAPGGPSSLETLSKSSADMPNSEQSSKLCNRRWPQLVVNHDVLEAQPSSPVARVAPRFATK